MLWAGVGSYATDDYSVMSELVISRGNLWSSMQYDGVCDTVLSFSSACVQAFGQSFLQPDINIFRKNLQTMEELNEKCKLYSKVCGLL